MISYMESHPENFNEAITLAMTDKQPYSWRAAWVLWSCMKNNDQRIRKYVNKIIGILPERKENQQRELLMILQRMELTGNNESKLFDVCIKIWEKTSNNPSLRLNALKLLITISKKHPNLLTEVKVLTESHYTDSLSISARKSILKLTKNFA